MAPGGLWARVWPSLVALLGTLAVVAAMLALFGGNTSTVTATPDATPTATPPGTESPAAGPTDPPGGAPAGAATPTPTPSPAVKVTVDVLNSSGLAGLGGRIAGQLRTDGWPVGAVGDYPGIAPPASTVFSPPDLQGSAALLAQQYPAFARVRAAPAGLPTDRLTLVIRKDAERILG